MAVVLIAVFLPLLMAFPAFGAVISQPDDTPTVTDIFINRNLYAVNDMLIYGLYDIPYDTIPSEKASETFVFEVWDDTETIEYGYKYVYPYNDYGYNTGLIALYFPATVGIVWESDLTLRIAEVDDYFDTPVDTDISITSANYSTLTTQDDNRTELYLNLYNIGQILQADMGKTFFTNSGVNTMALTSDGEDYYRGSISGLQAMCPQIFVIQQVNLDVEPRTWSTDQADTYRDRFESDWVGTEMETVGEQIGTNGNMAMALIVIVPLCIGGIIFSSMKFRRSEPGFVFASLVL
ncbi:MAG: hypothetical protein EHM12_07390, partial [Dehalococcoidia bacterium]